MNKLDLDMKCIPYPRKRTYWAINLPYLVLLTTTAVYLWHCNVLVSVLYMFFYVLSVVLHGYVCAFSGCPYKGTWCPGAFATFPVGKIARLIDKLDVKRSNTLVAAFFGMCLLFLLGIVLLPLYWLSLLSIGVAVGYFLIIMMYLVVFLLKICPRCAMRFNCPAARLSNSLHKIAGEKGILRNDEIEM